MTKEEIVRVFKKMQNTFLKDTEFRNAIDGAIELLSQTSVHSNLDEAAEKYADFMCLNGFDKVRTISDFKAGAEWNTAQGYTKEGIARPDDCEIWVNLTNTDIKDGDEVIIQIRKK